MIIDAHAQIGNPLILKNLMSNEKMASMLKYETGALSERIGQEALLNEIKKSGINACMVLPDAGAGNVSKVNSTSLKLTETTDKIYTALTLHPDYPNNADELKRFREKNIRGIKLSSFLQGFSYDSPRAISLFDLIKNENINNSGNFFIILDTFYNASDYYGTDPSCNTRPDVIGSIVKSYPEIKFIISHMGGLNAPINEIVEHLPPSHNLYLDTSIAAHTLEIDEFTKLLRIHGHERIIFGSGWPLYGISAEAKLIKRMVVESCLPGKCFGDIFAGNILKLLGITLYAISK